ncbi:MAG: MBL fold metallo-hydrolase [Dehalococcoidales bacterium]
MAVDIKEVAAGIFQIDDEVCSLPEMGAVYLLVGERKALVDSGPPNSASTIIEGIRRVGVEPDEIDYIIATHIHLDHAGGVGTLLESMPKARVVVHQRGARHLAQMEKLVASARSAQGDGIIDQYGKVVPVTPECIWAVADGDKVSLSDNQVLEIIDAPGHAPHEICIRESRSGGIFTGDALGLYLGDATHRVMLQIHPPPSLDLEACLETVARVKKAGPEHLYFAHFGIADKAGEVIEKATRQLRAYLELAENAVANDHVEGLAETLSALMVAELEMLGGKPDLYQFVRDNLVPPFIEGFLDYCRKKQKSIAIG